MDRRKQNISKFISLILRHKPETIGITIDKHGWANVDELVNGIKKQYENFDTDTLIKLVDNDSKQRYSFNEDKTLIRANQGHSIPVDIELDNVIYAKYETSENFREFLNDLRMEQQEQM